MPVNVLDRNKVNISSAEFLKELMECHKLKKVTPAFTEKIENINITVFSILAAILFRK